MKAWYATAKPAKIASYLCKNYPSKLIKDRMKKGQIEISEYREENNVTQFYKQKLEYHFTRVSS